MTPFDALPTPAVLVHRDKVAANIRRMQATCDAHGVELRPHIKTHKMVAVARLQLAAGARGLTCAKLGEAEAMLPSGVREIFIAHSLVDPGKAPRLAALAAQLDDLRVGVTSEGQMEALSRVAAATGRKLNVMLAVDTGLNREGVRSDEAAGKLAARLAQSSHLTLRGLYCHEGHFYSVDPATFAAQAEAMVSRLDRVRNAIDPQLAIWPGCSVTARIIAEHSAGRVQAVRPGAYMFGDLSLARTTGVMSPADVAVEILAIVIDRPEPGLALIDAGSKTFSSDRTPLNLFGAAADGRDINVVRVNEEHGYLRGSEVDSLRIGDRIRLVPAHVCTVINLTDSVVVTDGVQAVDTWPVDARGRTQ